MRVFLDTNIILDLLLERESYRISALLFEGQEKGKWELFVSALTMVNAAYIYRKSVGEDAVVPNLKYLSLLVDVLPLGKDTIEKSLYLRGRDYEDILQYVSASEGGCDAIITRNARDFVIEAGLGEIPRHVPVYSPEEFLSSV